MFCFYTLLLELYYTSNLYNGKNKSVCKEMNMRCDASMMIRRAFKWRNFCCPLYIYSLYCCVKRRPNVYYHQDLPPPPNRHQPAIERERPAYCHCHECNSHANENHCALITFPCFKQGKRRREQWSSTTTESYILMAERYQFTDTQ